jgi:hypothetical protein
MKLIADWGVHSPRHHRLLAIGCMPCRAPLRRLVRHDARAGGTKVWLACRSLARDHNIAGLAKFWI